MRYAYNLIPSTNGGHRGTALHLPALFDCYPLSSYRLSVIGYRLSLGFRQHLAQRAGEAERLVGQGVVQAGDDLAVATQRLLRAHIFAWHPREWLGHDERLRLEQQRLARPPL